MRKVGSKRDARNARLHSGHWACDWRPGRVVPRAGGTQTDSAGEAEEQGRKQDPGSQLSIPLEILFHAIVLRMVNSVSVLCHSAVILQYETSVKEQCILLSSSHHAIPLGPSRWIEAIDSNRRS